MSRKPRVYQLKITLDDIRPPIWRRLLVAENTPLEKLHLIFQDAMGWSNSHLHAFEVGEDTYGEVDPDFDDDIEDERGLLLRRIAPGVGDKFRYEYDFGDGWRHLVVVEKILAAEPDTHYPVCIKGKRACPLEDCGGPGGYDEVLEMLARPEGDRSEPLRDWIPDGFDPEAFDLDAVNRALSQIR